MPKIDAMLRMMSEKNVERAVLCGDKPYQIFAAGRCINGSVTPREQLRGLVEEIVPAPLVPILNSGKSFQFQYSSPYGTYEMSVSSDLGVLQLSIAPIRTASALSVSPPPPPATLVIPVAPPPPSSPYSSPVSPYPSVPPPVAPPNQSPSYPLPSNPSLPSYPTAYPSPYDNQGMLLSHRSRVTAGLLGLFLPGLGIHRFYLGYNGLGIVFLILTFVLSWFTCGLTAGIAGLWGTIEAILIFCDGMKDAEGRPLS